MCQSRPRAARYVRKQQRVVTSLIHQPIRSFATLLVSLGCIQVSVIFIVDASIDLPSALAVRAKLEVRRYSGLYKKIKIIKIMKTRVHHLNGFRVGYRFVIVMVARSHPLPFDVDVLAQHASYLTRSHREA